MFVFDLFFLQRVCKMMPHCVLSVKTTATRSSARYIFASPKRFRRPPVPECGPKQQDVSFPGHCPLFFVLITVVSNLIPLSSSQDKSVAPRDPLTRYRYLFLSTALLLRVSCARHILSSPFSARDSRVDANRSRNPMVESKYLVSV